MANSFTFDGVNRIIQIDDTDPVDMDVLYSKWKAWVSTGSNGKYATAFRYVGGDPTVGGNSLGTTYFILNDWAIRPFSSNHILQVDGNLFRDGGGNPFVPALGTYSVTIQQQVSNLVDQRVAENPIEDRLDYMGLLYFDAVNGNSGATHPSGTSGQPVNNITDALSIIEKYDLRRVQLLSDSPHPDNIKTGFEVFSNNLRNNIIFDNSSNFEGVTYRNVTVSGSIGTNVRGLHFHGCHINGVEHIAGEFMNCKISGLLRVSDEDEHVILSNCYSSALDGQVNEPNKPHIDFNGNTKSIMAVRGWNGHMTISNMNNAESIFDLDILSGDLHIEPSCTEGTINIRGNCIVYDQTDNNSNININVDGNLNPEELNRMQEIMGLRKGKPVTVTKTGRSVGNFSQSFTETNGNVVIVRD